MSPGPYLKSVVAQSGGVPEGGYGPGNNDTLTFNFSKAIDQPPLVTQTDINKVLEFVPPITDVNYTGWVYIPGRFSISRRHTPRMCCRSYGCCGEYSCNRRRLLLLLCARGILCVCLLSR